MDEHLHNMQATLGCKKRFLISLHEFLTISFLFINKEMELFHMDEFIDELLREERACDVILPRIQVLKKARSYSFYIACEQALGRGGKRENTFSPPSPREFACRLFYYSATTV